MDTIIRASRDQFPYTTIANRSLEDTRLRWSSRGVLAYLLAKPNGWQLRLDDLRNKGDLGRDGLYAVLKELVGLGYLKRYPRRSATGRIIRVDYVVWEVPRAEHVGLGPLNGSTLVPETHDAAEPGLGNPGRAQTPLVINKSTKYSKKQVTTTTSTTTHGLPGRGGDFVFPASLSVQERELAEKKLQGISDGLGQALLDELAGRMQRATLRGSPLAYLRGLVRRAQVGEFTPEAGVAVAAARQRASQRTAMAERSAMPTLPPVDPDHPVAKRMAQIRANRQPAISSDDEGTGGDK